MGRILVQQVMAMVIFPVPPDLAVTRKPAFPVRRLPDKAVACSVVLIAVVSEEK
jgi:hypothetical protein